MRSAASGVPAACVMRGLLRPPASRPVYTASGASVFLGVKVAVLVAASYDTVPWRTAFVASFSSKVPRPTVAGASASLNVAATGAVVLTFFAPAAGVVLTTVGGVVSAPPDVVNTRSTQ